MKQELTGHACLYEWPKDLSNFMQNPKPPHLMIFTNNLVMFGVVVFKRILRGLVFHGIMESNNMFSNSRA